MSSERIGLVVPGRTSSGGAAFGDMLGSALERQSGVAVVRLAVPAVGSIDLRSLQGCTSVVFAGSRAESVPGAKTVFWPLNVAPFENHVVRAESSSIRNRLRHIGLLRRLGRSAEAADGMVFGSFHARTLYQGRYPSAARKPYAVIRGGTGSGVEVLPRSPAAGAPMVLLVSHLYPYKGALEFVDAVALASEELPASTTFRVAGADKDPTYAAAVRRRMSEVGLKDRLVIAPAHPEEMAELYAKATLAVFTSTCENAGSFALYDGLHAGVPTICSDRSSMPEMVSGSVRLTNPCDPSGMARDIIELMGSADKLESLGRAARVWSNEAPTWDSRASDLLEFLEKLDGRGE